MDKKRREIIAASQVSDVRIFSLGGYPQKVVLDGMFKDAPILLCLHGGPGSPIPFSAGARGMFPAFSKHFIMVYWDQLGCGINDHMIDDTFTVDAFVNMTTDLIKALRSEFPNNRMLLLGTSWGSVLAAKAAAKLPDFVDGVLVYGQVLKELFFNEDVFSALLQSGASPKAKERVKSLRGKAAYTIRDIQFTAGLIRKYTDGYQCKLGGKLPMGAVIRGLLSSPDYSFKDFIAIGKNGFMKNTSVWNALLKIDLRDTLQEIRVPYRILQGSTDIVTSTKTIAAFVEACGNNHLSLRVLPDNGHIPGSSGMDEALRESMKLLEQLPHTGKGL